MVEWLEGQGYEPEAQVTQKGEMALRGGILDVFPLTSPWPVRLEFFGDELESLREFDPLTQISREPIETVVLPPGGELGLLKRVQAARAAEEKVALPAMATLLDYLPRNAIFIFCELGAIEEAVTHYEEQITPGDPFFITWADFQDALLERGLTSLSLAEMTPEPAIDVDSGLLVDASTETILLDFPSLDAFRPLGASAPDPQIADAQRREFFSQMHRWSRQGYALQVVCNNDGERQRFTEIWKDYGLDDGLKLEIAIGMLGRGFISSEAKAVVVTDAEIFGRYKIQRPRRMKSAHAQATRSALDIDFTEFEEGDYVVHLQHGIGRYLGLKVLPIAAGRKKSFSQCCRANDRSRAGMFGD